MAGDDHHLVGRRRELRLLDDALTAARGGEGRLMIVAGDPGVGKTRLCREIASHAEGAGFAVGWGTCWPEGGAPPLWPWQAVLTGLGRETATDLLGGDRGGPVVDPERFARFAAVGEEFARACDDSPVLVVIDDIHVAAPGAVLLARFLARDLARRPLALVFTRRHGEAGRPPAAGLLDELEGQAGSLTLRPLDVDETALFLRSYGYRDVDPDLRRTLWRLTGGNPLFLHRMIALGPADPGGGGLPPEDVRAAIVQAVDRLGGRARLVLSRSSVLGSSVLVAHAAAVADCTTAELGEALADAERAGLVGPSGQGGFTFTHELVRESLQELLTVDERCAAHARAADVLAPPLTASPPPGRPPVVPASRRLTRYAYHALRAAPRSPEDGRRAIAACRAAARAMAGGFDYEQAASTLEAAVNVHEEAGLADPVAALLVEWAQTVLMSGRLADARVLFGRAVDAATTERDPIELARAALGLGGVWVNEHRSRSDRERVLGLQRRALAALPPDEHRLRCRLAVRLAAEDVYQGGPVEAVLDALAETRRLGHSDVLAEALSLTHHALLAPRYTRTRLTMAEELIAVASPAGEGMLVLMGLCWRAVDLFHLGDPRAPRALAELRDRADALNCRSVLYIAEVMETTLLIRAGRLDDAEARATECFELGSEVGDADAFAYLGAQLVTIRWLQERDAEMLPLLEEIVASPTLIPAEFGLQATTAVLAARVGEHDKARRVLDELTASGPAALPESSTWLGGMMSIMETAFLLGDAAVARECYDLLAPYAELTITPSLAVTCLGSVERPLGMAALAFGRPDRAVEHLERAVTADRLLRNRPLTAVTLGDLAEALLRRRRPGDRERATDLIEQARHEAEAIGLKSRADGFARRIRRLDEGHATIRRQGRVWVLSLGDHQAVVPHRLGVGYLARLLTSPHRPISALELAAPDTGDTALVEPTRQPMVDERARSAYRRRTEELTRRLAQAASADPDPDERLRAERDALLRELSRTADRGGRTRSFPDPRERARTAVRKAIKRAIDDISAADATIGGLLRSSITTGATCCYVPDAERPLTWSAGGGRDDAG
ncbi:AAA family ATPase [Actinoallomurus purpureus]|uniref:ATP-binding protein n=1 Tax=Actinoallomurus purpureus TaxID=478114 RepID=UPI002092E368|nr:ATP-binding protein [Actinoallomurus purpureus]MCO6010768.1 AAA family ATPase [Actinoallomurus purpureus]